MMTMKPISLVLATVLTLMFENALCTEPPQCPPNMHFEACASACPENCAQLGTPGGCNKACCPRCVCDDGYILQDPDSGSCIPKEKCGVCTGNTIYKSCGTACPLTCENYKNPPKICTKKCVVGCACKPGFILRKGRECVQPSECKASCADPA
ncbi:zonadhesin-like [Ambystoma mexicanum]|uniref:zonadhesin-like n=1 Tax=Ambystoma mexicanum TaxID=8296 RepID=UPI0037E92A3A